MISTTKEAIKHAIVFHVGTSKTVKLYELCNRLKGVKTAAVICEDIQSYINNPLLLPE